MYRLFLATGDAKAILEYEGDLYSTLVELCACVSQDLLQRAKMLAHGLEWKQRNYTLLSWSDELIGVVVVKENGDPVDPSGLLPKFS